MNKTLTNVEEKPDKKKPFVEGGGNEKKIYLNILKWLKEGVDNFY